MLSLVELQYKTSSKIINKSQNILTANFVTNEKKNQMTFEIITSHPYYPKNNGLGFSRTNSINTQRKNSSKTNLRHRYLLLLDYNLTFIIGVSATSEFLNVITKPTRD